MCTQILHKTLYLYAMNPSDLLSIKATQSALRDGHLTTATLVEHFLARVEATGNLNIVKTSHKLIIR